MAGSTPGLPLAVPALAGPALAGPAPAGPALAGRAAGDPAASSVVAAAGLPAAVPLPAAAGLPAAVPLPAARPDVVLPAAVVPPPAAPPQGFADQLSRPVATLAQAGPGEHLMTVKVTPENLGPVTVQARIGADGVRIELFAPTDAGRAAVHSVLADLRRDLAGTGLGASLDLSQRGAPQQPGGQGQGQPGNQPGSQPGGHGSGRGSGGTLRDPGGPPGLAASPTASSTTVPTAAGLDILV
ncbi:flagellar hook-length control protein FliK [Sinomonas atrocyanea]